MKDLETIFSRHNIPEVDRPAFRALVESGTCPDTAFRKKVFVGPYKDALNEIMGARSQRAHRLPTATRTYADFGSALDRFQHLQQLPGVTIRDPAGVFQACVSEAVSKTDTLTPAESEIMQLMDAGHTVESAAKVLGVQSITAEWRYRKALRHRERIAANA